MNLSEAICFGTRLNYSVRELHCQFLNMATFQIIANTFEISLIFIRSHQLIHFIQFFENLIVQCEMESSFIGTTTYSIVEGVLDN